jgi:hypothetical protein
VVVSYSFSTSWSLRLATLTDHEGMDGNSLEPKMFEQFVLCADDETRKVRKLFLPRLRNRPDLDTSTTPTVSPSHQTHSVFSGREPAHGSPNETP